MSEAKAAPKGDEQAAANAEPVDTSAAAQKVDANLELNERLLKESKKYKERALAAERELESSRKAKLEEQGQYKSMYEASEAKYQELRKNLVKSQIKSSVAEIAAKTGCVNVDALLKLGNPSLLEYDEENNAVQGVELFVEDAKRFHPYLFNAAKPAAINPTTPNGVDKAKTLTGVDIAKLPMDQKMKAWEAVFKAQQK